MFNYFKINGDSIVISTRESFSSSVISDNLILIGEVKPILGYAYVNGAFVPPVINKEVEERKWRDSELSRTDSLVMLPDYPVDLLAYRVLLRNYPDSDNFPNGTRPAL